MKHLNFFKDYKNEGELPFILPAVLITDSPVRLLQLHRVGGVVQVERVLHKPAHTRLNPILHTCGV
jgi:hypothetical protein